MNPIAKSRHLVLPLMLSMLGLFAACNEKPSAAPVVKPAKSTFSRFTKLGKTSGILETAIVAYEDAAGRRVDLIAAVHLGEVEYYEALNEIFEGYEQLLYEMIKPESADIARQTKSNSILGMVQRGMKQVLELEFQLDGIDYGKDNFVHADLTVEAFVARLKERNETVLGILLRAVLSGMAKDQEDGKAGFTVWHLAAAMFSKNRANYLKFHLAQQLEDIEGLLARMGWDDDEKGSIILHDRNARAIAVLEKGLEAGAKSFGIFYGAAHMPDLERRLQKLGFRKTGQRWLTAWNATSVLPASRKAHVDGTGKKR